MSTLAPPGVQICNVSNLKDVLSSMSNDYNISNMKIHNYSHGKLDKRFEDQIFLAH